MLDIEGHKLKSLMTTGRSNLLQSQRQLSQPIVVLMNKVKLGQQTMQRYGQGLSKKAIGTQNKDRTQGDVRGIYIALLTRKERQSSTGGNEQKH